MNLRTLNYITLFALIVITVLGWQWPWGVYFIVNVGVAIRRGETMLLGVISREDDPVLFWMLIALWLYFGVALVLWDAAPELLSYG